MTTVKQLIEFLQTMPQDAIVITRMCSDYEDVEIENLCLRQGVNEKGIGLIRHNGHLMDLEPNWWPRSKYGERPADPEYLTAVYFPGN